MKNKLVLVNYMTLEIGDVIYDTCGERIGSVAKIGDRVVIGDQDYTINHIESCYTPTKNFYATTTKP